MSIYKSAINKPVTTLMIFAAVLVAGLYSLSLLPIDQFPEMEPPYVTVMTTYSGANAEEIETNLTKTLEDAFNSVQGIKEITSTSRDNMSMVMMEFDWGTDLDEAVNDVRDAIDMIYDYLPDGASRPAIFKLSTSMMPILMYSVTADQSYSGLEKLLEEKVVNPLKRIDGIGSVSIIGAPERYVYVDVDAKKLDATGLSLEQLTSVISTSNLNMPAGSLKMGKEHYQIRVEGEFQASDEIKDLVVGTYQGASIHIRDIAKVNDTIKDLTLEEKANRQQAVRLMVTRQSGANSVEVCEQVKENLVKIQKTLPSDVQFSLVFDTSDFISSAIGNLSETLLLALIFVVFIVLLFIGRWRASVIIALTIPISLVVAAIYLFATGSTLNIISLSSLSIAIGMVVDDAIVVLENITKHIRRGSTPREAAIYATNEVWVSVILSTLVIVAVFLPLTMVGGMIGVMFKELGWIVTITVVTSTVAAITLTPMLSAKLLKGKEEEKETWYDRTIGLQLDRFDNWYERILRWALGHKKTVVFSAVGIFVASLFLFNFIGTDFMPSSDQSRLSAAIELQSGTRVEETMKVTRKLEDYILTHCPEVELLSTSTGSNDESSIAAMFRESGTNLINLNMRLSDVEKRKRSDVDVSEQIRQFIGTLPEVITYTVTTGGVVFGGTSTVDVEIFGYDFDKTNALAAQVETSLKGLKGARDVSVSRDKDKAELQVVLDKEKLALHNLNSATVSTYVRNRINGATVGLLREDGEEYDIVVRLEETYRNTLSDVEELTIPTPTGGKIKLKELGEVKELWSPPNIEHKRRERLVTVKVTPVGVPLGTLAKQIQAEVDKLDIPSGIIVNVGGAYEDQQESFADIGLLLLAVMVLVYLAMASQFESYSKPFVIMFSVPFAFTGVAVALFITGTSLSMIAAIGLVMLVGIVVKNGVVLVDFINLMRDRGLELSEAIAVAGKSRLRPVIMTALTSILGMLPMAMGIGEGSETWAPLGVTIVGGLFVSTMVTMILIPVLYAVFARRGERDKQQAVRKKFIFMDK
ncbi:MAG: Multidrug resistance protein MdtC [Bacteroidetes bacterium ADurb.Bin416]|nr:MAG: Multidrug resistance protein MdtC [Bacteroidetes bacterium ADurb.Bin416]